MTANISPKFVPSEGSPESAIWFIGEAPGGDEESGTVNHPEPGPFIGESGSIILTPCLMRNGLSRPDSVFITNLSHYRPKDNKFEYLIGSKELADGISEIQSLIVKHKPTVICTLGNWPMYFVTGKRGKKPGSGILNWRGSILTANILAGRSDWPESSAIKVIPTVHPAAVYRDRKLYPIFDQDIKRVIFDSTFRDLRLPQRKFIVGPKSAELEHYVQVLSQAYRISVDIETFGPNLACVGFSHDPDTGICIINDNSPEFRDAVTRILISPARKNLHFGVFDQEILHILGYEIRNYDWDNQVAQYIMWPELPRSHKYLCSIYTREPYYKDEGKEALSNDRKSWGVRTDRTKLWIYNCKDDCTELEVQKHQEVEMNEGPPAWKKFMQFSMEMLEVAAHISRAGMLVDLERLDRLKLIATYNYAKHQDVLERLTYKEFNANSPKQVQAMLYEGLKLPIRKTQKGKVTADEDALISLIALCKEKIGVTRQATALGEWQRKFLIIKMIMLIRGHRKLLSSYLNAKLSGDGRIRSLYKVPATETGRWSAEKYVDGSGVNAMTFPRDYLEIPEDLDKFERVTLDLKDEENADTEEEEDEQEEVA